MNMNMTSRAVQYSFKHGSVAYVSSILNCQNIYVCARLFVYLHATMRRTQVTSEQFSSQNY